MKTPFTKESPRTLLDLPLLFLPLGDQVTSVQQLVEIRVTDDFIVLPSHNLPSHCEFIFLCGGIFGPTRIVH